MATILRSSRYIRGLSHLARRVTFTRNHADTVSKLMLDASVCSTSPSFVKSYANTVGLKESESIVDHEILKLNEDAKRYGRLRRVDLVNILQNVKATKKLSSTQALMLINCCGNLLVDETPQVRLDIVKDIWNNIEHLAVPVDISHYNALLRVYLDNEYSFSPVNFLVELEKKNIEANRVTYQRFITRYCNTGDIAGATKILEFMKEKQLPINENVFNSLITGYARAGDIENAVNVLNVMKQGGVNPSATTYGTLLCAYGENGDIEAIRNVLATCQSQEIFLMDKDYLDVIYSLISKGHKQYAEEIMSLLPKSAGYTLDATNLVHKLVNINEIDLALQVLLTIPKKVRHDGKTTVVGSFFLKKLALCNVSAEKIIEVCKLLESKDLNSQAFYAAIDASFEKGDPVESMKLLKAWQETGATMKQHFFWPILAAHGNQSNFQGILETIDVMTEFGLTPSVYTLREFVLPYVVGRSIRETATVLLEHNVKPLAIINGFSFMLLESGKSSEAYEFMLNYSTRLIVTLLIRPLVDSFLDNGNVKHFVNITRLLVESEAFRHKANEDGIEETQQIRFSVPDTVLFKFINNVSTSKIEVLEQVLEGFTQQGFTISAEVGRAIEERCRENITPRMSEFLSQLTSGKLTVSEIPRSSKSSFSVFLEKDLENIKAKGGSSNGLSKILLMKYMADKNEENVTNLLTELRGGNFEFNPGLYAQLIDFYSTQENLAEAEKYFIELKSLDSSRQLDNAKTFNYATLLVKNDRYNEALQLIQDLQNDEASNENKSTRESFGRRIVQARRLLEALAERGDPDQLNVFFKAITSKKLVDNLKPLLTSLVKVHVVRNDLETALTTFEQCAMQHNCTPYKEELSKVYILAGDAASLQRLTDISTKVHGEVNSLHDLAIVFIDCDRVRQAKKILETPGLFGREHRLIKAAENYSHNGDEASLQKLLEATKNVPYNNRSEMYYLLLSIYHAKNNWAEGLATWMTMQEENVQPSEKFLQKLALLLRQNGQNVPFVHGNQTLSNSNNSVKESIEVIEEHIDRGQFDSIEGIFVSNSLNFAKTCYTTVIQKLLNAQKLDQCVEFTKRILTKQPNVAYLGVFRKFMEKVSEAGKISDIEELRQLMPSEHSFNLLFNKCVLKAHVAAGQFEEFLKNLEKEALSNSETDWYNILHNNTMYNILETDPSFSEKCKPYAVKMADNGSTILINILWCYYFKNRKPEADEIWSKYLANNENLLIRVMWNNEKVKFDSELLKDLTKKVHESNMSLQNKTEAYNNLLFACNAGNLFQEGVELLNEIVNIVPLESMNFTILQQLKLNVEKSGHSFPYNIAEQRKADAAST